ncbi:hypothetical protein [Oscillibacter sp. GMB15532]|uniref:hypothetical protein n=1 Tax=Oscillibacter sp. GMB15532 TaxID=3230022 RepID=UPI0034DE9A64
MEGKTGKKKFLSATSFGIIATWFGMHCGSGFATGTQYTIYYSKYGWLALIMPFITWAVLGGAFYFIFEYERVTKINTYKDYAQNVFIKKIGILFVIAIDLWSLCAQMLGVTGILAGTGSLFEGIGVPYYLGVVIMAAIVLFMTIFGVKTMMKISSYITYGLIVIIVILGIIGVAQNWSNFWWVVSTRQNDGGTFLEALKSACTYSGVQIGAMFAIASMAPQLEDRKESAKTAIGGALLNVLMLQILGMVIVASYPDINAETLPVLTALNNAGIPGLVWLYRIMLFLALLSTGAGCAFAIVARWKGVIAKKLNCSETVVAAVIAIVMMVVGTFGSKFGLVAVFSQGYGFLSKLAWPLGILPAFLILPWRIHYLRTTGKDAPELAKK